MGALFSRRALTGALWLLVACNFEPNTATVDPTCSDFSCGWTVEEGSVARAGTWNSHDFALSLLSTPVRVSRAVATPYRPACWSVTYVGDIAEDAQVDLSLDFNDDGSTEVTSRLRPGHWSTATVVLRASAEYQKLRLRLQKSGTGVAKLARFLISDAESPECDAQPAVTLQNGARCSADTTCTSGRCVSGSCGACGPGGCLEGEACRAEGECKDGGCAAGVCRACAKLGTCATNAPCSLPRQCASGSCAPGSVPSMKNLSRFDGICGECQQTSDCASGLCVLGRCSECALDSDCDAGRECRYFDAFDALSRGCVPRPTSRVLAGALCESDQDCSGVRCGAATGRAKRCGVACGVDSECAAGEVCIAPAALLSADGPALGTVPDWLGPTGQLGLCLPTSYQDP
ncbi:MAG: hypothetical protein JWN04_60 [Myxococcaceae bacterium]|nr:hypothetical protein [Myxococcaceae bacterium]